jgi:YgiT-type zinc finger domain-containing protein
MNLRIESLLLPFTVLQKRGGGMTGKPEENSKKVCPLCGGKLREGLATIPFVLDSTVAVVKDVPAEICEECDESYMKGDTVDRIEGLLQNLRNIGVEVSVIHYKAA